MISAGVLALACVIASFMSDKAELCFNGALISEPEEICVVFSAKHILISYPPPDNNDCRAVLHVRKDAGGGYWRERPAGIGFTSGDIRCAPPWHSLNGGEFKILDPDLNFFLAVREQDLQLMSDVAGRALAEILQNHVCLDFSVTVPCRFNCNGFNGYIGTNLDLPDLSRVRCNRLSGNESPPNKNDGSNREDCHDPLCERIARANKSPDQPIPVAAYIAAVCVAISIAGWITLILCIVFKPEKQV